MRGRNTALTALSRAVPGSRRERCPAAEMRRSYLSTRYHEKDAAAMAREDGQIVLSTRVWGESRRFRGEPAVLYAAATHVSAALQWPGTAPGGVSKPHLYALRKFRADRISVDAAETAVAAQAARTAARQKKLTGRGREPPPRGGR